MEEKPSPFVTQKFSERFWISSWYSQVFSHAMDIFQADKFLCDKMHQYYLNNFPVEITDAIYHNKLGSLTDGKELKR